MKLPHHNRKLLDSSHTTGNRTPNVVVANITSRISPSVQFLHQEPIQYSATSNISQDDQQQQPYKPTLGFDSSMALTVLVLLSALFFMVFFSMYLRRFADDDSYASISQRRRRLQQLRAAESSSNAASASSSNGLDAATVRSLPMFAYDGNSKEPVDCAVCLSEFEEKETVKVIPFCGHVFHPECIDTWFGKHVSCPLCRSTQLFRSSSPRDEQTTLVMKEKRGCASSDGVVVVVVGESRERSTAGNGDTCVDGERSTVGAATSSSSSSGVRRISSCTCLEEKVSLTRSLSF